ncbi:MAG: undecaprenyl-diphosphate phosphatase [Desulfamplus sp.]|nr:undecaprenyl-diphosphate phosphatase [Desulfamplus sp.]
MEIYHALLFGIVQGLTEFLPVSSSGHLALGQYLFEITEPTLFFDISLHIGTLLAVVIVFFTTIKSIAIAIFNLFKSLIKLNLQGFKRDLNSSPDIRFALLIVVASIPTAFIGLALKPYIDTFFDSINFVGVMLITTGTFLWFTKDIQKRDSDASQIANFSYKDALFIGLCQGVAVLPGISRSGATITAGLFCGIDREQAARFSFLLSIPAIVGAELLGLKDILFDSQHSSFSLNMGTLYGTAVAFVVGYVALKILLKIVKVGRIHLFAPYCWILGVVSVVVGVL